MGTFNRYAGQLLAGVTLAALTCAAPALADEAKENDQRTYAPSDIIVTAKWSGYIVDDGSTSTKTPTALIDTPQAVSVITRDQLDDQNVRHLGEALRYVAGISMETGEGHRDEVFIRGQESSADFYLNGLRDDAQYYRSLFNVERVEVLKGSNALTFGRGGGGGIINRDSKTADPKEDFIAGGASVDMFGAFAVSADINKAVIGEIGTRLNATYEECNNHRDFYEGRYFGIAPTVTFQPGSDTRITLSYSYEDDKRVTDRGVPALDDGDADTLNLPLGNFDNTFFGDPDFNEASSQVHIAHFRVDHDISKGLSVNFSGQYANYDKLYANILPRGTDGTEVSLSGYRDGTKRENLIGQGNLVWQGSTGSIGHTLLAGFEMMRQDTQNFRDVVRFGGASSTTVPLEQTITVPAFTLELLNRDRDSNLTVLSSYVQDQIEIGDFLQLIAGIRYESFDLDTIDLVGNDPQSRKDKKWSPRFGIVVKPQENLSIYGSYTESFLPQSGNQFTLLSSTTASLAPEKFKNIELGVKWAPRADLLVNAAIFQLTRSNTPFSDLGIVQLTGKSRVKGVELSVAGNIMENWHVNAGYTYLDGEIISQSNSGGAGTQLQQVPKHHIAAWTRYDFTEKLGVGVGVVHSSSQFASFSNEVLLPSYTRVDAAVYFDVSENIALQVNVENLFDETYYASAHGDNNIQPAKPLSASISAKVRF